MQPSQKKCLERECRTCKKTFFINQGEIDFLTAHGFPPYTHCRDCRRARKAKQILLEKEEVVNEAE